MSEKEQPDETRVVKREFLARVADNAEIPLKTVNKVYEAIIEELINTLRRGDALVLTGFGKFYRHKHKGHRVQFGDGSKAIGDYSVLKFSATRAVNKSLADPPTDPKAGGRSEEDDTEDLLGTGVPLAVAATQSPRVLNRSRRKLVQENLKDPASARMI